MLGACVRRSPVLLRQLLAAGEGGDGDGDGDAEGDAPVTQPVALPSAAVFYAANA